MSITHQDLIDYGLALLLIVLWVVLFFAVCFLEVALTKIFKPKVPIRSGDIAFPVTTGLTALIAWGFWKIFHWNS